MVENDNDNYDLIPIKQSNLIEIICATIPSMDNSYVRWIKLIDHMVNNKTKVINLFVNYCI